jgi:hypothetical protein
MDAFKDFVTKAAELYLAAPAFFNWAVPLLLFKSNRDAGLLLLVGLLIDAALSNVSA